MAPRKKAPAKSKTPQTGEVLLRKTALVRDVKAVARNDGNKMQLSLLFSMDEATFAKAGSIFDQEVMVQIEPQQLPLPTGDGKWDEDGDGQEKLPPGIE